MPIDYKNYPPNWKTEIVPAVLQRANNRCEECGIRNHAVIKRTGKNTWRYPTGVEWDMVHSKIRNQQYNMTGALRFFNLTKIVLTVAHLDNDPENWEVTLDRLKALCQKCHLCQDKNIHIDNRKYGRKWKKTVGKLF